MRAVLGSILLLTGIGVAKLHFLVPEEPVAIEQVLLVRGGGSASGGAGGLALNSSRGTAADEEDLSTVAPWERRTVVIGSTQGNDGTLEEPLSGAELARALQSELKRVGCYHGAIDGDWGPLSRSAMSGFTSKISSGHRTEEPLSSLLPIVRQYSGKACGSCADGQTLDNAGRCVPSTVLAGGSSGDIGVTAPAQRPEPLPGRMTVGGPVEEIGAYVALTREAESSTVRSAVQNPQPRVTRRARVTEHSSPRRAAPQRQESNWAQTFFERIERR